MSRCPTPMLLPSHNRFLRREMTIDELPCLFAESDETEDCVEKRREVLEKLDLAKIFPPDSMISLADLARRKISLINLPIETLEETEACLLFGDKVNLPVLRIMKQEQMAIAKERKGILQNLGLGDEKIDPKWPLTMNDLTERGIPTGQVPFDKLNGEAKILFGESVKLVRIDLGKKLGVMWALEALEAV